ncbi:hypothetical protein SISNIDRAFT_100865 [Sistotremastrum niveocremeum HHB9708]|uniref:Uncharacterized protein n=1 Tax=Sistotremastrum niveocremeum HHB9708 TaxID=1314777 RepID=A0A164UCL9_9AGAM|nr:hypothetical protein SISNIDRAFT_100865 [Sistotremastrum niveocremeum HHB9708]
MTSVQEAINTTPLTSEEKPSSSETGFFDAVVADAAPAPPSSSDAEKLTKEPPKQSWPPIIYTRKQLLRLHASPLVKPPDKMPSLKDWIGEWPEQHHPTKKDPDSEKTGRERRPRRDNDDNESAKPSFKAALINAQPSQMGNFKHQSHRVQSTTERGDRDRENNERDRDLRDREGQERLRNLSDRFDRERLAVSASHNRVSQASLASEKLVRRDKDRDRDTLKEKERENGRKRAEGSDDWRRGAVREGRRDQSKDGDREASRERIGRDKATPQATDRPDRTWDNAWERWDTERPKRSTARSPTRRDRSRVGRRDRSRDTSDKEDQASYSSKLETKPSRAGESIRDRIRPEAWHAAAEDDRGDWRDDLRSDEHSVRDSGDLDSRFDVRERKPDRTATASTRAQRNGPRRGKGLSIDEDREKEPAWMETYIPEDSKAGILGSRPADGQLDGIQAWKKELREREMREKGIVDPSAQAGGTTTPKEADSKSPPGPQSNEPLDEISMFKLIMKREQGKDSSGEATPTALSRTQSVTSLVQPLDQALNGGKLASNPSSSDRIRDVSRRFPAAHESTSVPQTDSPTGGRDGAASNLTLLTDALYSVSITNGTSDKRIQAPHSSQESSNAVPYDPPRQSRLLAFGLQSSTTPSTSTPNAPIAQPSDLRGRQTPTAHNNSISHHSRLPSSHTAGDPRSDSNGARSASFDRMSHSSQTNSFDLRNFNGPSGSSNAENLHSSFMGSGDQRTLSTPIEGPMGTPFSNMENAMSPTTHASGRGSRFAKFFDGKSREGPAASGVPKSQPMGSLGPVSRMPDIALQSPVAQQQSSRALHGNLQSDRAAGLPGQGSGSMMSDNAVFNNLLDMLHNSSRAVFPSQPDLLAQSNASHPSLPHAFNVQPSFRDASPLHQLQPPHHLHQLKQQQQQQQQQQSQPSLPLDGNFDMDARFQSDNMVPGLRPNRLRDVPQIGAMGDSLDDPASFAVQRFPPGSLEHSQTRSHAAMLNNQALGASRGQNLPFSTTGYRGGPSPIGGPNVMPSHNQQRLPPGLANLGGRPPHDPSHFIGNPMGAMHANGLPQAQPQFPFQGNVGNAGTVFGMQQHPRGPTIPNQNMLPPGFGVVAGGHHPSAMDFTVQPGRNAMPMYQSNNMRGGNGGFNPNHGGNVVPNASGQPSLASMRLQQQQGMLGPLQHMQAQQQMNNAMLGGDAHMNNDLMALLLNGGGGPLRE